MGDQRHCNELGALVKPFDPNLTGKFNYQKRLQIMENQNPNEKEQVELPKSLRSNERRNYSPQPNLLEGYAQMPRTFAAPYKNEELKIKRDLARRKRSVDTAKFFRNASNTLSLATSRKNLPAIEASRNQAGGTRTALHQGSPQGTAETLADVWNQMYAKKLASVGPGGIKKMNLGTSYLVAPIYTQKREFKDIFSKASSFLQ